MPAGVHRAALRLGHRGRRLWFRLARPRLAGVRIIVVGDDGHVLLVRHSYGAAAWFPPGGHMRRGEDAVAAARREAREELGIGLVAAVLVERREEVVRGARIDVHVVAAAADTPPVADGREIAALLWVRADDLPGDASPMLTGALAAWVAAWPGRG